MNDRHANPPAPEKLGVFGGTFDPVHVGHLILVREMAEALGLERLLFVPACRPPHKDMAGVSAPEHRLAMLRLATAPEPDFAVDDREMTRGGSSYTFDTLRSLRHEHGPSVKIYFLIGADSLPELKTWYRAPDLFALAHFATAVRPGFPLERIEELRASFPDPVIEHLKRYCVPTTPIGISSTRIRHNVLHGKSIRHMVPRPVEDYIRAHGLYRGAGTKRDLGG